MIGLRKAQAQRIQSFHVAAPTGGDDTISPGTAIPPGRSILSYNLIGAEYGLRSRLGWREWVTGLGGIATPVNAAFSAGAGTLAAGTYYYRVAAKNAAGSTPASTETSLTLGAPGGVNVNWGAVTGATGYDIFGRFTGVELLLATVGAVTTWLDNGSVTPAGALPTTNTTGEQVRSLLAFTGSTKDGANNRLFAVTTSGIWNVSASTQTPLRVVDAAAGWVSSSDAGWGISTVFVTSAGHFLCYCDDGNGYWLYTEATTMWARITAGAGANQMQEKQGAGFPALDPTKLAFVCAWKNRLLFVERDTGRAWFLPVNQVLGTGASGASPLYFGNRFKYGGDLRGLWSWTHDGGAGMDDHLVAISGGGDVVVYGGTDPSTSTTFGIVGVWAAGAVPAGRRFCTDLGGDLLIMSSMGILSLDRLTKGPVISTQEYQTSAITNLFNQLQASTSSMRGWAMRLHPAEAALIVLVPVATGQPTQQLAMSLTTKGWHRYRDMPMGICAESWGGIFYFGTEDGRVCTNTGYLDGVLLSDPNSYSRIHWSLLTAPSNLGRPTRKRVQSIRLKVLSQGGALSLQAQARYNLDLSEASNPPALAAGATGSLWDVALWDTGKWGGDYAIQNVMFGATGMGQEVALAIRGASSARTTLLGADVLFDEGGVL